jgi:hypothetical protein
LNHYRLNSIYPMNVINIRSCCGLLIILGLMGCSRGERPTIISEALSPVLERSIKLKGSEHTLAAPTLMSINSKGEIAIGDQISMKVFLFSSEGEFLQHYGSRGRGEGEFQTLTSIYLSDSSLVVIDANAGRSNRLWADRPYNIANMHALSSNLIGVTTRTLDSVVDDTDVSLFHVMDSSLSTIITSYFPLSVINEKSDSFYDRTTYSQPGFTAAERSSNVLFYAPYYYSGVLWRTELDYANEDEDKKYKRMHGSGGDVGLEMISPPIPAYRTAGDFPDGVVGIVSQNTPNGRIAAHAKQVSLGLFSTSEGGALHLYTYSDQGGRFLIVSDEYDVDGNHTRGGEFVFDTNNPKNLPVVLHYDGDNLLYVADFLKEDISIDAYSLWN